MSRRFLCGVPEESCFGSTTLMQKQWKGSHKVHISREDAFKCHVRYLLSLGYTRLGAREFAPPNDGPVRVLTRSSRFGSELRWGKEQSRWMTKNPAADISSI